MTSQEPPADRPPPLDKANLKAAMRAFRKRLKLARLDDESRLGGGSMTHGARSGIAGIRPPDQFPAEVWAELARQGRLLDQGSGIYALND